MKRYLLPLLSLLLIHYQVYTQIPDPVAHYPFSGDANDISGYGNHGVLSGSIPVLTEDRFGNPNSAFQFGGYYSPSWIHVAHLMEMG